MTAETVAGAIALDGKKIFYNRFLLIVAGLGGLLYGIDVGIIAGALPYLEATSGLNAGQLSIVVAAVLLGVLPEAVHDRLTPPATAPSAPTPLAKRARRRPPTGISSKPRPASRMPRSA